MGLINPDLSGALHGDDLKPAVETILREMNGKLSSDNVEEINANQVNVYNLNADNINTGTLTGVTIQTAASGLRTVLNSSAGQNTIDFYDSTDTKISTMASSNSETNTLELKLLTNTGVVKFVGNIMTSDQPGIPGSTSFRNATVNFGILGDTTNVNVQGDLLPSTDNSRNLGNDTYRWQLVEGVTVKGKYKSSDGTSGVSGSFTAGTKTVTVKDGIITSIV